MTPPKHLLDVSLRMPVGHGISVENITQVVLACGIKIEPDGKLTYPPHGRSKGRR